MEATIHSTTQGDLFFDAVVEGYVQHPRFLRRDWLADEINQALDAPNCRFLRIDAEPGAGTSTFLAQLRYDHPQWPIYFIRRDQRTPLGDVGPHSFLLHLGYQLAALFPDLFDPKRVKIDIEQNIEEVGETGEVVGVRAERILASPFYEKALKIRQTVAKNAGRVTGLSVGEFVVDARLIALSDLQYMALFDPAKALQKQDPSARIVILVDALDELRYHGTQETLMTWLRNVPEMPANVRFVLTGRPPEDALRVFREKQRPFITEFQLSMADPRVDADARAYVDRMVTRPEITAALSARSRSEAGFTEALVAKADGNLGYLDAMERGLDQALAGGDEEAVSGLLALEQVPQGLGQLNGFFLHQVKVGVAPQSVEVDDAEAGEVRYVREWYALYQKILSVLSVAREPLTLTQLQALGRIATERGSQADALGRLRQFLDQLDDRYRLYHASLPGFLTAPQTHDHPETADLYVDATRWHQRIADYYWQAGEADWRGCDAYGLNNLATHLYESGDYARLHALINKTWKQARYDGSGSTYGGFLADVDLAWQAAEDTGDLLTMVRLQMVRQIVGKQVQSSTDTDLQTMVWLDRTEEALSRARLRTAAKARCQGLQAIYAALYTRDEADEALLDEALETAQTIPDDRFQTEALAAVALAWAQAGKHQRATDLLGEAEQRARTIEQASPRWTALAAVAVARTQVEGVEEAETWKTWIAEIEHETPRARILGAVAKALAHRGRFDEAAAAARTIEGGADRAKALAAVAAALTPDDNERATALFDEALASARASESADTAISLEKLITTKEETDLEWSSFKAEGLAAVAVAMAQAEEDRAAAVFAEAETVAHSIEKALLRLAALAAVASARAQTGRFDEAEKAARAIPNNEFKAKALGAVALALAQAGDDRAAAVFAEAETVARTMQLFQAEALAAVAVVLAQSGAKQKATALFEEAGKAVRDIPGGLPRSMAIVDVAKSLAQAGRFRQAGQATLEIPLKPVQFLARTTVATVLAQAGKKRRAAIRFTYIAWAAGKIEGDTRRSPALAVLASALIQAGRFDKARRVAEGIAHEPSRSLALALAQPHQAPDVLTHAAEAARAIEQPLPRAIALVDVAAVLAQAGRFEEAEQVAGTIGLPLYHAQARTAVATALAQAQRFSDALRVLTPLHPNHFLKAIAGWTPSLEQREPGLGLSILRQAVEVAAWEMPGWQQVHAMLSETLPP